jgi:glutamate synthase domain-containing protein 1/glutamate synthase domain-containing protein 3
MSDFAEKILASRKSLIADLPPLGHKPAEEGGCGVVGFAASVPVSGRHIYEPSVQMHNRGNGKGGGIAAAGFVADQLGISADALRGDYLLQIALIASDAEGQVEEEFILPYLEVDHKTRLEPAADHRDVGLDVQPPDIVRYFVRARDGALSRFAEINQMTDAPARAVEDEFIYQNSFRLNQACYAALGEKQAFVLSHARDLMVFKIVGYAEQVVQYYGLENLEAHVWIAHQRYPTKGRVWHPAGAHPFIGMNEALVHNGDFANYFSITRYLRQHNIAPLFLTDTEVSVQLFDLWHRIYGYPLEYVIEALAPTTELDFEHLPAEKKRVYRAIQALHMHGSPDGPWFFIIARSNPDSDELQLLGITDTSMLRPQVFALQEGEVTIGLVASEKQAVDATLHSLAAEDSRFRLVADRYWNARGGSHTDGGAFTFTVQRNNGHSTVACMDKFGKPVVCPPGDWIIDLSTEPEIADEVVQALESHDPHVSFSQIVGQIPSWNSNQLRGFVRQVDALSHPDGESFDWAIGLLSLLNDRRYDCGRMKRSVVLQIVRETITAILGSLSPIADHGPAHARRIDWDTRGDLRAPEGDETILVIYARDFPPEGDDCDSRLAVAAYELGWRRFIVYGLRGQRFAGCGFGPDTDDVRIDVFGSPGDYLASGIDGMEIHVHGNGQDQLGQIMKRGTLVVHGDVGQTFMYGAKGGEVYVMGNAAGRPLINAVGRPRVVINGTCLDFLAESFMAGDPHSGGGFAIVNGIEFDDQGRVRAQESPYPGSNLFSLASGGAIFVRDPRHKLVENQLNGGEFAEFDEADWQLILPYLQANERHFGVFIERDLLTVDGVRRSPAQVYRKVRATELAVLRKQDQGEPVMDFLRAGRSRRPGRMP